MSRILLVIGLASTKAAAEPELVYLGRSGDAMRQAIATATHPRLIVVPHVHGIPKNNSRVAANVAAEQAADAALDKQLKELIAAEEDAKFGSLIADRDRLAAELADLTERVKLASQNYVNDMSALTEQLNVAQREAAEAKAELARYLEQTAHAAAVADEAPPPTPPAPTSRRRSS